VVAQEEVIRRSNQAGPKKRRKKDMYLTAFMPLGSYAM
jgi:hypothetical protein